MCSELLSLQGKEATVWGLCGQDSKSLDYSSKSGSGGNSTQSSLRPDFLPDQSQVRAGCCTTSYGLVMVVLCLVMLSVSHSIIIFFLQSQNSTS